MIKITRIQDRIEIVVGIWLLVSPWVLGYAVPFAAAAACASIVGVAVLIISIDDLRFPNALEEWMSVALGTALMASPWIVDYSNIEVATTNALLSGLAIAAMAVWSLWLPKEPMGHSDGQTPNHA